MAQEEPVTVKQLNKELTWVNIHLLPKARLPGSWD